MRNDDELWETDYWNGYWEGLQHAKHKKKELEKARYDAIFSPTREAFPLHSEQYNKDISRICEENRMIEQRIIERSSFPSGLGFRFGNKP